MSRITPAVARTDAGALPNTSKILLELEPEEASALASLASQVEQLLGSTDPGEQNVSRLYPVAYADAVEAADFARYTRPALQERKTAAAQAVRHAIEGGTELDSSEFDGTLLGVEIDEADLWPWLTFLTDLRLVLVDSIGLDESGGVRHVEALDPAADPATDPVRDAHREEAEELLTLQRGIYDWAAFLQDSLVAAADHSS